MHLVLKQHQKSTSFCLQTQCTYIFHLSAAMTVINICLYCSHSMRITRTQIQYDKTTTNECFLSNSCIILNMPGPSYNLTKTCMRIRVLEL